MVDTIKDGVIAALAYEMAAEGEVLETATADDPLYYLHGSDNIVPGLEAALAGKGVGDTLSVTLEPSDAYGDYDDEEIQEADLNDFELPDGVKIGDEIEIEDEQGDVYLATIKDMTDETITLDFNSPLAGMRVTFNVEVLALREASPEELEDGEPAEYAAIFADHDHAE